MTGRERVLKMLSGQEADRSPILPILHSGLAGISDVRLGDYFSNAETMARVIVAGARRFGFDGVQLTLGVAAEPEALGARTEQPPDGAPVLRQHLLADLTNLERLREQDPGSGGRMPLFFEAVKRVYDEAGDRLFVVATLRGPLNITSQLRGVEEALVDMIERPEDSGRVLDLATDIALAVSKAALTSGADALMFGEATCSPNFISPDFYRRLVLPRHLRLVRELRVMGWRCVGFHVCGNIVPILEDLISTGADLIDVDYQVPAAKAIELAADRVTLRGNLDPSAVFRFGSPDRVRGETQKLRQAVGNARWILSSGCDIPPGTPESNLAAFVQAAQ